MITSSRDCIESSRRAGVLQASCNSILTCHSKAFRSPVQCTLLPCKPKFRHLAVGILLCKLINRRTTPSLFSPHFSVQNPNSMKSMTRELKIVSSTSALRTCTTGHSECPPYHAVPNCRKKPVFRQEGV
jgi:hypothetical protein